MHWQATSLNPPKTLNRCWEAINMGYSFIGTGDIYIYKKPCTLLEDKGRWRQVGLQYTNSIVRVWLTWPPLMHGQPLLSISLPRELCSCSSLRPASAQPRSRLIINMLLHHILPGQEFISSFNLEIISNGVFHVTDIWCCSQDTSNMLQCVENTISAGENKLKQTSIEIVIKWPDGKYFIQIEDSALLTLETPLKCCSHIGKKTNTMQVWGKKLKSAFFNVLHVMHLYHLFLV